MATIHFEIEEHELEDPLLTGLLLVMTEIFTAWHFVAEPDASVYADAGLQATAALYVRLHNQGVDRGVIARPATSVAEVIARVAARFAEEDDAGDDRAT